MLRLDPYHRRKALFHHAFYKDRKDCPTKGNNVLLSENKIDNMKRLNYYISKKGHSKVKYTAQLHELISVCLFHAFLNPENGVTLSLYIRPKQ